MAKKNVKHSTIPWFISIPRTGSNWIQGMMELYFDRPRGPILNLKSDSGRRARKFRWVYPDNIGEGDLLWNHHHDQQGFDVRPSTSVHGDIFLYRNPMDVVYSNCKRDGNERRRIHFSHEYNATFTKWTLTNQAKTFICYEDMVDDPISEFKKIVDHFNAEWDEDKFKEAYEKVTKKALVERGGSVKEVAYPEMLTKQYQDERVTFRRRVKGEVKGIVYREQTAPLLDRYFKEEE